MNFDIDLSFLGFVEMFHALTTVINELAVTKIKSLLKVMRCSGVPRTVYCTKYAFSDESKLNCSYNGVQCQIHNA